MTKRFSILQKKLQELESQLNEAFSLPSETPYHQLFYQDIDQRILFLRILLSAELTSSPERPHHLDHIGKRLSELETAFHHWDEFRTTTHGHQEKTASTCSCTESCLNDDEEETIVELGSRIFVEGVVQDWIKENAEEGSPVMEMGIGDHDNGTEVEREERGDGFGGKWWWALGGGVVIGMALMGFLLVRFCGCFTYVDNNTAFLAAT